MYSLQTYNYIYITDINNDYIYTVKGRRLHVKYREK